MAPAARGTRDAAPQARVRAYALRGHRPTTGKGDFVLAATERAPQASQAPRPGHGRRPGLTGSGPSWGSACTGLPQAGARPLLPPGAASLPGLMSPPWKVTQSAGGGLLVPWHCPSSRGPGGVAEGIGDRAGRDDMRPTAHIRGTPTGPVLDDRPSQALFFPLSLLLWASCQGAAGMGRLRERAVGTGRAPTGPSSPTSCCSCSGTCYGVCRARG